MIKSYLLTALRNLKKNKLISFINIFGLSLAFGCTIVAYQFIKFQYEQDSFHEHRNEVFLVTSKVNRHDIPELHGQVSAPIGKLIKSDFASVQKSTRIDFRSAAFRYEDVVFKETISFVDNDYFEMMTFPLKWGNVNRFEEDNSIILSEAMSTKYFGTDNPIGKQVSLLFGENQRVSFTVGGVFEKFPRNASFYLDILVPFRQLTFADPKFNEDDWTDTYAATFIQLSQGSDKENTMQQMSKYVTLQNAASPDWPVIEFQLEPLSTLSFRSEYLIGDISGGSEKTGRVVIIVLAVFMLLLACLNYINTALASGAKRLKEIGIRKVMGGFRHQLIFQFIAENIFITFIAFLLGIVWAITFFLPGFESLFSIGLQLDILSPTLWYFGLGIAILTGFISGAYPAFYISAFKPLVIFRGRLKMGKNRFTKVFLTIQFILAIICISFGFTFVQNSNYQLQRSWGYERENVIVVPLLDSKDYETLKSVAAANSDVKLVGATSVHMGNRVPMSIIDINGEKKEVLKFEVGENYLDAMNFELLNGDFPNQGSSTTESNRVVVNETFVNSLGYSDNPLNVTFRTDSVNYLIVGVIKDFHYYSFYDKIQPLFIKLTDKSNWNKVIVQVEPSKSQKVYDDLKSEWQVLFPDQPFDGYQQTDTYDWYYTNISGHGKLSSFIAILSMILSCMGLFGLVSLNVTFRMKEYSIRKVLGAGLGNLTKVMNKEFILLLLIALIIGIPLSYWMLLSLINSIYPYHMPLNILPNILGGIVLLLAAVITISSLIYKVISTNPAEILRSE